MSQLEKYFEQFRKHIIGIDQTFNSPLGEKKIVYADWVASGRLYRPIEEKIINDFGPFTGNTHTDTNVTGTLMTQAYHESHQIIKDHVNAGKDDVIITAGFGMTTAINKFQRILGLKIPEQLRPYISLPEEKRPVVFLTHMEHHSNQTSWLETIADVVVIEPNEEGLVNYSHFEELLEKYKKREFKIGSFTAASNVTGAIPDYYRLARMMHERGGFCFVDFAMAAPYVEINMHPENESEGLDAIFFSPHKFLGGPGSAGVLIFNSKLYNRTVPDHPGGGTVEWTNPWGGHKYFEEIELREDGGTPGFLQSIKAALAIKLKEKMGVKNILAREEELLKISYDKITGVEKLHLLANNVRNRLGVLSFYVENVHYNLIVKLLNDYYGIQVRGGCSCAGTYGHYLLHIDPTRSKKITEKINRHDLSEKPGWVRLSLHPTMTNEEINVILNAIEDIIVNIDRYSEDYNYSKATNEFIHKNGDDYSMRDNWFKL
ncbi:MAG: aminotransferase class V-fold PLP-dependent enzyme [Chlorobi bacterium]|nr:aminotransferase class V-fold PLP-dependent enzyme [Chlorobiota bacterium]